MLDQHKYIWLDVDSEIKPSTTGGGLELVKDVDAVITSIENILGTIPGERVMRPEFGSSLIRYVFDNIDDSTAMSLQATLRDTIEKYEPRVTIKNIDVTPEYDYNGYDIKIFFSIKNANTDYAFHKIIIQD